MLESKSTVYAQHSVSVLGNLEKLRCLERGRSLIVNGHVYSMESKEVNNAVRPYLARHKLV